MKSKITLISFVIAGLIALVFGSRIFETVEKGTYQIKQAAVSGEMSAHMTPGMYMQAFGDIQVWPKSETFYFISDANEGGVDNTSIRVRFVDGSETAISGTMRYSLPTSPEQAISLITKHAYMSPEDLEAKLILPIVRKALINTANLMTARESYAEKKTDFFTMARDQVENGMYLTEEYEKEVIDPTDPTGVKKIKVNAKRPRIDPKTGDIVREANHPLSGTGIRIVNFEVKRFDYPDRVQKQIAQQQENLMAIATAKSLAKKAEQDAITIEQEGLANVTRAKYIEEEVKVKAVVVAQRDKEVAETHAHKELEVAKLERLAARETKQKLILLGQGEATRKRLVMSADGALQQKLDTWLKAQEYYATAMRDYKGAWVPNVVMGINENNSQNGASALIDMLTVKTARDLSLDMSINAGIKQVK